MMKKTAKSTPLFLKQKKDKAMCLVLFCCCQIENLRVSLLLLITQETLLDRIFVL